MESQQGLRRHFLVEVNSTECLATALLVQVRMLLDQGLMAANFSLSSLFVLLVMKSKETRSL
jgi:hypothetical protein